MSLLLGLAGCVLVATVLGWPAGKMVGCFLDRKDRKEVAAGADRPCNHEPFSTGTAA